jgi:hypothetical protein
VENGVWLHPPIQKPLPRVHKPSKQSRLCDRLLSSLCYLRGFLCCPHPALPGTILDRAWALNPRAHAQLAPLGRSIGLAFSLLALLSLITTFGWFRRRLWAWRLCVAGIFVQSLGDFVNFFRGDHVAGALGILLATALLVWLLRPNLRSAFAP